jgi:hypothetical protein
MVSIIAWEGFGALFEGHNGSFPWLLVTGHMYLWLTKQTCNSYFAPAVSTPCTVSRNTVPAQSKAFQWSLQKSIQRVNRELWIYCAAVLDVMCKWLKVGTYKLQLLQKVQENDLPWHYDFAVDVLSCVGQSYDYFNRVCFSCEAIIHFTWRGNHYNCWI